MLPNKNAIIDEDGKTVLEETFAFWWRALAPDLPAPTPEYRFAAEYVGGPGKGLRQRLRDAGLRDWRFDFAWPDRHVAVECEGGVYTRGAHGSVSGILRDIEKYNAAAQIGWTVIRLTPTMLYDNPIGAISMVREALERGKQ